jgi:hypothetical protein
MFHCRKYYCLILNLAALLLASCADKAALQSRKYPHLPNGAPNYGNLNYWAAHPWKHDLADSVPKPLRHTPQDSSVDVFYLHPTLYFDTGAIAGMDPATEAGRPAWNALFGDSLLNVRVDNSAMLKQASAFNHYRLFAPRYRQAHYNSYLLPDSVSKPFFEQAYSDVRTAFDYYLEHYNGGRPFILASHSQGTTHAAHLMQDTILRSNLHNRLVAAYLLGMPIPENKFADCPPCETAQQTGCFIAWRTMKRGYLTPWAQKETFKAVVVNPLTWTRDTAPANRQLAKGAMYYKFNKLKPHNVATQIHGNVLWSTKPRFLGNIFFTRKDYHIGDINIFWLDIRDNAEQRVRAFWKR